MAIYRQSHLDERRLGVGDDLAKHGRISDAKLDEIEHTLAEFTVACAHDGAAPVVAIGTAAFRDAPNAKVVIDAAAARGVRMEVVTEQRESELAYLVGSLGEENVAVIDNGSRSIELVADQTGTLHHHVFNLGYRLAFEEYFARAGTAEEAVASFRTVLDQHAARAPFMRGRKRLVGIEFGEMAKVLFPGDELRAGSSRVTSCNSGSTRWARSTRRVTKSSSRPTTSTVRSRGWSWRSGRSTLLATRNSN